MTTVYGFDLLLPCMELGLIGLAVEGSAFHRNLLEILQGRIQPGDVIIDGGSNFGSFSLWAASQLQGRGMVVAFEPDHRNLALLQENLRLNHLESLVRAEGLALTNRNGECDFFLAPAEGMLSSLLGDAENQFTKVRVSGTRLDDYLALRGISKVDGIKLDLEGGEHWALEGMEKTLRGVKFLIFEVNHLQLSRMGVDPAALVQRTSQIGGFDQVLLIHDGIERPVAFAPQVLLDTLRDRPYVNVVCLREPHRRLSQNL